MTSARNLVVAQTGQSDRETADFAAPARIGTPRRGAAGAEPGAAQPTRLAPGRAIPGTRYEIGGWLGEGGMGVVYQGRHLDTERRVALKILRSEFCHDAAAVQAFRDEARATSTIGSDDILQIFDFAELPDGRLMIAMELLEGRDLFSEVGAPLEFGRIIAILRQVCRGLFASHQAGVVHRDVKPENVFLVTSNGRPDKVKLVDFGIAAFMHRPQDRQRASGTAAYLAPETLGHGPADGRVDQYVIGCMAYELVTGTVPFSHRRVSEVLAAQLLDRPEPPSELRPSIPPALEGVIMRCLEKRPEDRYADMRDLEAALCEAQIAAGLHTAWDDLPIPEVEPERRDRLLRGMPDPHVVATRGPGGLAIAVAAVLLALVASLATYLAVDTGEAGQGQLDELTALEHQARDAAAKALFVYPPADAPATATAYAVVRKLERIGGVPEGIRRGLALRSEFAATLSRLGDEYWALAGGRSFAAGYYQQALLFDGELPVALARAEMSPDELARLDSRATDQSFSDDELVGMEPLMVLAAPDDGDRDDRLDAWRKRASESRAQVEVDVGRIIAATPGSTQVASPRPVAATPPTTPAPAGVRTPEEVASKALGAQISAKALSDQGRGALRGGRTREASDLFERALARDKRHLPALVGLRDISFDGADYGRAVQYGERVVGVAPKKGEHWQRLGDAYFKVLRYADAERAYQRAVDLGESRARWRLDKVRTLMR